MADSFEIPIKVTGGSAVEAAAGSVDTIAAKLTAASSAAEKAASAVSAGERVYAQAQRSYDAAAKAVERLGVAARGASGEALGQLLLRQGEAAAKASAAKAAMSAEAATLDKLRAASVGAADAQSKMSKALEDAKKKHEAAKNAAAAAAGTGDAKKTARAFADIGGPLGTLAQKFYSAKDTVQDFEEVLGKAGPYALAAAAAVALAAGITILAASAVAAIASLALLGVKAADAARTQKLLVDGIAGSVKAGDALEGMIEQLGRKVPLARDELLSMAQTLRQGGLTGKALEVALDAAAIKAAKLKFGPDFAKQLLSIDSQTSRLKSNLAATFGGLKIEKLLEGFSHLVELFSNTNASGRAMKVVFESLFQPLIDGVVEWIPKARSAFIQFEILVLKALIAVKPFGSQIVLVAEIIGVMAGVLTGVLLLALGLVIVSVTVLAGAIALTVTAIVAVIAGFVYLGSTLSTVGQAIYSGTVGAIQSMLDYLSSVSLADLGNAMIDGLVSGIAGGAAKVVAAMGGVVSGAVDGAKNLLGIASPSKVFAEIGANTAEGFAGGVDDAAPAAATALESLVQPPAAGASAAAPAPAAKSESGNVFQITINGVAGAQDAIAQMVAALDALMIQSGGAHA